MFEPGCHLRLASAQAGSNEWHQFSNAYYSNCDQIQKNRVRFVDDKIAYVFMQWWYSVTTDGGNNWSNWDVAGHLSGQAYYYPELIQDVSMKSDGNGTMALDPKGLRSNESLTLYTRDFGLHWDVK